MCKSKHRGHIIYFDDQMQEWLYFDNRYSVKAFPDRPCVRCGKPPTSNGHDSCLGKLPDVVHACCGHGFAIDAYTKTKP